MDKLKKVNYNDTYVLHCTHNRLQAKLWSVHDMDGNDISHKVDRYDWEYLQQWASCQLWNTFCYLNEC